MTEAKTELMRCPVIECPWTDAVSDDQDGDDDRAREHLATHSVDEWVHAVQAWHEQAETLRLLLVVTSEAAAGLEARLEQAETRMRAMEVVVGAGQKSHSNGDPSHPATGSSQPTAAS